MIVGVPAEIHTGEQRVALSPVCVDILAKLGIDVLVEREAGVRAGFQDQEYRDHGASITTDRKYLFASSDVLFQVQGVGYKPESRYEDIDLLVPGQVILGLFNPLGSPSAALELAQKEVDVFALELLPRISRAQSMDALTSMATIAGYKAVLLAAGALPKMYMMMMTAAGTIAPARVLVVGAGVAGLQAIATSRRLGAVVHAYDIRPSVKEEVESLGAKFVDIELDVAGGETGGGYARDMGEKFYDHQKILMADLVAGSDVVITTAAVPGKRSPILITKEMVLNMTPGSVIVDLAADMGGNCESTLPGETVRVNGVSILGPANVPSTVPYHASQMYSRNLTAFLKNLVVDGKLFLNLEDQIVGDTLITHKGEVVNPVVREALNLPVIVAKGNEMVGM